MFSKSKKPPSGNCQCNHFFKYGCQGVMLSWKEMSSWNPVCISLSITGLARLPHCSDIQESPRLANKTHPHGNPCAITHSARGTWVATTFLESNLAVAIKIQNIPAFWPDCHPLETVAQRSKGWKTKEYIVQGCWRQRCLKWGNLGTTGSSFDWEAVTKNCSVENSAALV